MDSNIWHLTIFFKNCKSATQFWVCFKAKINNRLKIELVQSYTTRTCTNLSRTSFKIYRTYSALLNFLCISNLERSAYPLSLNVTESRVYYHNDLYSYENEIFPLCWPMISYGLKVKADRSWYKFTKYILRFCYLIEQWHLYRSFYFFIKCNWTKRFLQVINEA